MDAKLSPISSSAAGTPLAGKSISAQSGNQAKTNSKLTSESVQDTLETSDREADGRQIQNAPPPSDKNNEIEPDENGNLLDLHG